MRHRSPQPHSCKGNSFSSQPSAPSTGRRGCIHLQSHRHQLGPRRPHSQEKWAVKPQFIFTQPDFIGSATPAAIVSSFRVDVDSFFFLFIGRVGGPIQLTSNYSGSNTVSKSVQGAGLRPRHVGTAPKSQAANFIPLHLEKISPSLLQSGNSTPSLPLLRPRRAVLVINA